MLLAFTIGLASVFMSNGSLKFSDEIFVDLPQIQSDSVIFITPKKHICMPFGGGSHANPSQEFIEEWKLNCLEDKTVNSK